METRLLDDMAIGRLLEAETAQEVLKTLSEGEYEDALAHHCRKHGYEGVVCGHIHHAEITDFDGVTYMNCGDWVESCTALVEDDQGVFRIIDWTSAVEDNVTLLPFEDDRLSA